MCQGPNEKYSTAFCALFYAMGSRQDLLETSIAAPAMSVVHMKAQILETDHNLSSDYRGVIHGEIIFTRENSNAPRITPK